MEIIIYLVKVSALLSIFYGIYWVFLRELTFYSLNRVYLLMGIIISAIVPLYFIKKIVYIKPVVNEIPYDISKNLTVAQESNFQIDFVQVFIVLYVITTLWFAFKLSKNIIQVVSFLQKEQMHREKNFYLVNTQKTIEPYSFFKWIVINPKEYNQDEYNAIIQHEVAHSKQWHSVDVIIGNLLCVLFWFNPVSWLYKKAIIQNTEYLADTEATKNVSDKKMYQKLLLKIVCENNNLAIINHFNQSLIKKRIVMLNKNQSKTVNFWKYMVVFPAVIAFIFLFQQKVVAQVKDTETRAEVVGLSWDKNATEEEFKSDAKLVQEQGVTLEFKNVVRNAKNEITSIDIYFKDKMDEKRNMKNFSNPNGIETIYFKRTYDSKTGKYFFGFVSDKNTFDEDFNFQPNHNSAAEAKIVMISLDENDPDEGFYSLKDEFKNFGITIKVWGIKRNSKNQIIEIHAQMNNEKGKTKTFDFKNSKIPLKAIEFSAPNDIYKNGDDFDIKEVERSNVSRLEMFNVEKVSNIRLQKVELNQNEKNQEIQSDMKINIDKINTDVSLLTIEKENGNKKVILKNKTVETDSNSNPLVVVNGKIIQENSREYLEKLNPETIKEINVLKGEKATEKYGEKAINGAIEIKLK